MNAMLTTTFAPLVALVHTNPDLRKHANYILLYVKREKRNAKRETPKATFRLQSFLSVRYNVIGLSNVFTHQKKLVVSHKKVAETELRYT